MKFKDKDGNVFDDIDEVRWLYCIGRGCETDSCNLATHRYACGTWVKRNPSEAARLMGYEVVKDETVSNADHIRSMTDEELAEWLENVDCLNCECCVHQMACRFEHDAETVYYEDKYDCLVGRMDWLKQPYKEDT